MAEERAAYDVEWDRQRIAALRERLGLTQAELAKRLGIRQQTVSEWETGRYRPRGASVTLLRMAEERAPYDAVAPVVETAGEVQGNVTGIPHSARSTREGRP